MILLSLSIGCAFSLLVLVCSKIISGLIAKRRCQTEAVRLGCEPAPAVPTMGFLGLTRLLDHLKASREERGSQQFVEVMNELGQSGTVHTCRVKGKPRSFRADPLIWRVLEFDMSSVGL